MFYLWKYFDIYALKVFFELNTLKGTLNPEYKVMVGTM